MENVHKIIYKYLVWMSTTRKEVPIIIAMQRDIQNTRVSIEGLLGAVAMVHILDKVWVYKKYTYIGILNTVKTNSAIKGNYKHTNVPHE